MEFQSAGYFIHDAPWRSVYGPGSDGPGQPGTNYGGTHGCVNVPLDVAAFLYGWASIGTPVVVVRASLGRPCQVRSARKALAPALAVAVEMSKEQKKA